MEIKIGIRHIAREIVVETSEAKEILMEKVSKAIEDGSLLQIMDDKGNTTLISGAQIGYVELGSDAKRSRWLRYRRLISSVAVYPLA